MTMHDDADWGDSDDNGEYDDDQNLLVSSLWYLARVAQEKELVTVETTLGPGTNEKSGFLTKKDSILNIWLKVGEKLCGNLGFADAEEGMAKIGKLPNFTRTGRPIMMLSETHPTVRIRCWRFLFSADYFKFIVNYSTWVGQNFVVISA